jgi:DNA repair protein RadA/Sms
MAVVKSKSKSRFTCQSCAATLAQWQGQCPNCREWKTIVEEVVNAPLPGRGGSVGYAASDAVLCQLGDVRLTPEQRLSTGLKECDHVLGGGLVSDSVVLIGGDPGIGKSTLLLQVLCNLAKDKPVLYVTGEESLQQVAMRANRLGFSSANLPLLAETRVEKIIAAIQKHKPEVVVIDSIQTVFSELVSSAPGSVSQVRESASQLVRAAKTLGVALFLVGHVTKEGAIAGPRVLEHMVDTVLYFEGQSDQRFRIIRAVKNRFGAVNEIGVFAMTDRGLKQVSNPSAIFLSREGGPLPGSTVMVTWEGSRPLLVEVQALVDQSHLSNPRRVTVGLEQNRLAIILAVLHRHGGVATYDQDVFVNVVGGLRVLETGADLAVMLSILSSLKNKAMPDGCLVFGEIGLSGELRPVPSGIERIREAAKHGFTRAIVPAANAPKKPIPGIEVIAAAHIDAVLAEL